MKLLLLCDFYTVFVTQLRCNLKKYYPGTKVSIFTSENASYEYMKAVSLDEEEKIYSFQSGLLYDVFPVYKGLTELPRFDIIQPLWMEIHWGLMASVLKKKTDNIYISVGGSDLYRQAKKTWIRLLQKRLIRRSSVVSSENKKTRNTFYATYGDWTRDIPHFIARFGVDIIDSLLNKRDSDLDELKKSWRFPCDRIIIMLGHNGSVAHQHIKMIHSIDKLNREQINRCFFVIPMTYGVSDVSYRQEVEEAISEITDDYLFLDRYLDTDEMAQITMITDIMIHMQTSDQLSSTMMAHLYNGNIVLAGSWLPYHDIKEKGITLFDVDDFEALTSVLSDVIGNIEIYKEKCELNPDKVYEFSSWEYCIKDWHNVYSTLIKTVE